MMSGPRRWSLFAALPVLLTLPACNPMSRDKAEGEATPTGARPAETAAAGRSGQPTPGADTPGGAKAAAGTVPASELEYTEMKVVVDQATGNAKEDNFRFFKVWGELKNKSSKWVEQIVGDIRYFDASGKELALDSIGTAVKKDVGDTSPGERIDSEVMYIAPGASVPMHHIRSLDKIGGKYGSYKISLRPARVVSRYPEGVLEGVTDQVANVVNDSLSGSSPHEHRVISGTVRNKGTLGCRNPGVVVGYYDAAGKLTDLKDGDAKGDTSAVLAPGATVPVKVFTLVGFDDAWKAKATIKTWVRCVEPYD
jgi:hypothetical protein